MFLAFLFFSLSFSSLDNCLFSPPPLSSSLRACILSLYSRVCVCAGTAFLLLRREPSLPESFVLVFYFIVRPTLLCCVRTCLWTEVKTVHKRVCVCVFKRRAARCECAGGDVSFRRGAACCCCCEAGLCVEVHQLKCGPERVAKEGKVFLSASLSSRHSLCVACTFI